ncbi:YobI family P-loop NTPase [Pectobacterium aroidearum]|uniref:YobI family P-loop NTPase n=1 Tax=Pectobacterium aroidearum TaxID=1201031 RepID=UPI002114F44C|nr:hypothetical protein [Pectobacterium aroidearum]UUE46901.1 hypothetical protein L0Y28_09930 [Pectobacterium aroidearum]UUE51098.1 hypothetical protein L0Y23_09815 [Pectobacterium aroidearum]UUE55327.1 hypothetical protein L0Y30_09940 [Pectobacterium aroidearum]UUE63735.1 hypothetical protein L0Y29_09930 [Pectobacterium aroidearum]UUE67960.1 hypothetical protein L0Y22_09930 [Pectobacterium aroidearum]
MTRAGSFLCRWFSSKNKRIPVSNLVELEPLTPKLISDGSADPCISALNTALDDPCVRNIALTGPYGSGKSSVLLTWRESRGDGDYFLTVSLADFDVQRPEHTSTGATEQEKQRMAVQEKSIEYSILQQILYAEKKSKLPHSRIERIGDRTARQLLHTSIMLLISIVGTGLSSLLLFPTRISGWLDIPELGVLLATDYPVMRFVNTGVILTLTLWSVFWQLDRIGLFDRKIRLDKVDLLKGTLSAQAEQPSLLNVCIDEIVYFFAKTRCRVVIFEDLDRFDDGRIFIKLREINQIINNNLSGRKGSLRFIYAVRDDIFKDAASRTKFFDIIIPVIPVLDSQNALSHLLQRFSQDERQYPRFDELLKKVSRFIPDMRVMRNITNEFRVYQNMVNNRGDITKLLAMICYKNIFTEDYNLIDTRNGLLFHTVDAFRRGELQSLVFDEIESSLQEARRRIIDCKKENSTDTELRRELLEKILPPHFATKLSFMGFSTNSYGNPQVWSVEQLVDSDSTFRGFFTSNLLIKINLTDNPYQGSVIDNVDKSALLKEYETRVQKVHERSREEMNKLRSEIGRLEKKCLQRNRISLSELLREAERPAYINWLQEQGLLINETSLTSYELDILVLLLTDGFLSTDYMSFRSVFREGALSISDNDFIRAVTAHAEPEITVSISLEQISSVWQELQTLAASRQENALHPQLLLWLMRNRTSALKILLAGHLDHISSERFFWLHGKLMENWGEIDYEKLILLLAESEVQLEKVLMFLHVNSVVSGNQTIYDAILLVLMQKVEISKYSNSIRYSIQAIFGKVSPKIIDDISISQTDFFVKNMIFAQVHYPILINVTSDAGRVVMRSIAENNLYKFSLENLTALVVSLSDKTVSESEFRANPLTLLEKLDIPAIIKNTYNNLAYFVRNVFIASSDFSVIPTLLCRSEMDLATAELIVTHMDFELPILETLPNITEDASGSNDEKNNSSETLWSLLLEHRRIRATWDNVFSALREEVPNNVVGNWLNACQEGLIAEGSAEIPDDFVDIVKAGIICNPSVQVQTLERLIQCISLHLDTLPNELTLPVMSLMVSHRRISHTIEVWEQMKTQFSDSSDNQLNFVRVIWLTQSPELLSTESEMLFPSEESPDSRLIQALLEHKGFSLTQKVALAVHINTASPELIRRDIRIPEAELLSLNTGVSDDDLRLSLLISALKGGLHDRNTITTVLNTFNDDVYRGFLKEQNGTYLPFTYDLKELARLLENANFIRKFSISHKGTKIWIGFNQKE